MDDFGIDRQELTGSMMSMEFGQGGRIQQLWTTDPSSPEDSEEFQFIAPPLMMGEETTEDYFPGTILIGARTHPEDPWIVSRNARAEVISDEEDASVVAFEYEFSFLDEIRATGKFYEIPGIVPQIAWDVEITNRSRRSVEIGELGFPLALNNVLEGFNGTDNGIRELWNDRVYVHKFFGGAASYVFAQRMTGRPPGVVIFPGGDTKWEFFNHVPASLATPFRWEGIPVVYVHSQAAIEREGWGEWFGGHTALVLEPGESRKYEMRFAPADREMQDNLSSTLAACGRPALKVFPGAVAPIDVGIGIEVGGATPTRFFTDVELELETDADEEGGFCFLKPSTPGAIRLGFEDTQDRESEAHLLFIEPITDLIQKRADWIMEHQVCSEAGPFYKAILPADLGTALPITDPEAYTGSFGVEASLSDALFLAEKNRIYPERAQVEALDDYIDEFLQERLQNPGDGSVGSTLSDTRSVASNYGRPQVYPLVTCLYHSMARVASSYGFTRHGAEDYLRMAAKSITAMFQFSNEASLNGTGIPLMSYIPELVRDLREAGLRAEADALSRLMDRRDIEMSRRRYPFFADGQWSTNGFEEAFAIARRRGNEELEERVLRCAYAARSLSLDWWWYGSDKRWIEDVDNGNPAVFDKGELCLGASTAANSLIFFKGLERDYSSLHESTMRMAFGGLLGPWALVRSDGAASMAFCPDAASKQFGMSAVTGDIGTSLFNYLRGVGSYVLPSRSSGVSTFGCHFESESDGGKEYFTVKPWDGVGRRVVVRQFGLDVQASVGQITEVRIDSRKRHASVTMTNHSDLELVAEFRVRGMWGSVFTVAGHELAAENGELKATALIPANGSVRTDIVVKR